MGFRAYVAAVAVASFTLLFVLRNLSASPIGHVASGWGIAGCATTTGSKPSVARSLTLTSGTAPPCQCASPVALPEGGVSSGSPTPSPVSTSTIRLRGVGHLGPPHVNAPRNFIAVLTAAQVAGDAQRAARDVDYLHGLDYFTTHFSSVLMCASETQSWPLLDSQPFYKPVHYYTSALSSKSAKESDALRSFVRAMNATIERDFVGADVIVFKGSGRYQPIRDTVLQTVIDNPNYDVWYLPFGNWYVREGKLLFDPGHNLAMTFYFAMRWRLFREFYLTVDLAKLDSWNGVGYDVERAIVDFVKERGLRSYHFKQLDIVAKIGGDSEGAARYF